MTFRTKDERRKENERERFVHGLGEQNDNGGLAQIKKQVLVNLRSENVDVVIAIYESA